MRHGDMETWRHGGKRAWGPGHRDVKTWETWRHGDIKRKTEAQTIFLNPCNVCSSRKWKLVICPFLDELTKRTCPSMSART
jgi:hypothetical protein